jgi:S1-C subfamily serine protease
MDEQPAAASLGYRTRDGRTSDGSVGDGPVDGPVGGPVSGPSASGKRTRARSPGWQTAGVIVVALLVAAAGTALAIQQSRLHSTRSELAALQSAATSQNARVDALEKSVEAEQKSLTGLSTQLASTTALLQSTQTGLQSAQTRLTADEKQLNLATAQLPPDLTALAAKISPSVVLVTCATQIAVNSGTGFALAIPAASGFATAIITAAHVINDCASPTDGSLVSLSAGTKALNAHVRAIDSANDVAILDTTAALPVLAPSGPPVVGEFLMAVGNALGIVNNNVTSGNVSQVHDTDFYDSAPISSGNSGGPVVDRAGKVVGIVDASKIPSAGAPIVENINISLRLSTLCLQLLHGPVCDSLH